MVSAVRIFFSFRPTFYILVAMTNAVSLSERGVDILTVGFQQEEEIGTRQKCRRLGVQSLVRLPPQGVAWSQHSNHGLVGSRTK